MKIMTFKLRDYQEEAIISAIDWIKQSIDPAVISAPTGSGKALMACDIAKRYFELTDFKRKTLMLAPTLTLVKQNYETWIKHTQSPASLFTGDAKTKCLKHNLVIGTPVSVHNQKARFNNFGLVLCDESQETTPTIKRTIEYLRTKNKNLRVIGLSGTPYRLGEGYIYKNHYEYGAMPEDTYSYSSYYHSCICDIPTRMLIERGYLTPPVFDENEVQYDTSHLIKNRMGKYDSESVNQTFVGKGRLTAQIVEDVVNKTKYRNCVLWFAATIEHAFEIFESLPKHNSVVIHGGLKKTDVEKYIKDFKTGKIRHLINVAMLHRGFDAPHIDSIAILRATESAALYLQIIGRGLRLHENKTECLILDYAHNVETIAPNGDIFEPEIKSKIAKGNENGYLYATCPQCNGTNYFKARENKEGYKLGDDGYFKDLMGYDIKTENDVPMPSHYGRRCLNQHLSKGVHRQCSYRWSSKQCNECNHHNDITAKKCEKCKGELIDPNEKLRLENQRLASDPYALKIKDIQHVQMREWPGKDGKPNTLRVDYVIDTTPHTLSEWYSPESTNQYIFNKWLNFKRNTFGDVEIKTALDACYKDIINQPKEVAYRKKQGSKYYEVVNVGW